MAYTATIGFFDGVHKGHQFLIRELKREALHNGTESAIITFAEHPENILCGTRKPLLTTLEERTERLRAMGVDEIFCFQFELVRHLTAIEFMRLIHHHCGVDVLLMGYDHRFGSDRLSRFEDYQSAAAEAGLVLHPIQQAPEGDISSSKIRKALQNGDVKKATEMLGTPYTMTGTVTHGKGIGRQIGYPTANIELPKDKLVPRAGVYAVRIGIDNTYYPAILNIGTNPTISAGNETTIEVHIPHFSDDIYGRQIDIELTDYIREEKRFDTIEQLKAQIAQDLLSIQ